MACDAITVPFASRASSRTVTGDWFGLNSPRFARKPVAAEVFATCGITPRRSALARLNAGTNWPKLPLLVFTKVWEVAMMLEALVIRRAPTPVTFNPEAPTMSLRTAVPRAGRLTAADTEAFVLGVVPAGKNSISAVVGVSNDGLQMRRSVMNF